MIEGKDRMKGLHTFDGRQNKKNRYNFDEWWEY